jgi:2-phosphosulfolactate phosphatase
MTPAPLNFPIANKHHFCWGQEGLTYYGAFFEAIVIVDVLSFCTTVDIALAKGCSVIPTRIDNKDQLVALSTKHHAVLAKKRSEPGITLSPSSMQKLDSQQTILLPSPNGSTLVDIAAQFNKPVFTGCLRNSQSLSDWLNAEKNFPVLLVAAGERYPNKTLRFAMEDYWGAGSILLGLDGERTIEAEFAIQAFLAAVDKLENNLIACESGQELVLRGFGEDVSLAAAHNISETISILSKKNGCWQLYSHRTSY